MEDVKSTLQKLKPFIGKKADSLWIRYSAGDREEKQEWTQVISLLAEKHKINPIEEEIVLPPPKKEDLRGEVVIGKTQYLNQPSQEFGLNLSELTRHIGIFGSTGTGKTTLAKNILRELIKKNIPFIVFDWKITDSQGHRGSRKEECHKPCRKFNVALPSHPPFTGDSGLKTFRSKNPSISPPLSRKFSVQRQCLGRSEK
jgi:hypothetical protein